MGPTLVFTLSIEHDHLDELRAEDLHERLRTHLEDELVYGNLADDANPVHSLELTYHWE